MTPLWLKVWNKVPGSISLALRDISLGKSFIVSWLPRPSEKHYTIIHSIDQVLTSHGILSQCWECLCFTGLSFDTHTQNTHTHSCVCVFHVCISKSPGASKEWSNWHSYIFAANVNWHNVSRGYILRLNF